MDQKMNKTVAWWDGKEPNVLGLSYHQNDYCTIPLYTHPVKELTDEEIISSAEEVGFYWSEDKGIFVRHHNGSWIGLDVKMVDFARAILRKAQEK